jgi:hypothetical protein
MHDGFRTSIDRNRGKPQDLILARHTPPANRHPRGKRILGYVAAIFGVLLMVTSGSCSQSASDSSSDSSSGSSSASGDAVIFGRVLSSPGMASHEMAKPSGVAGMTVTVSDAASSKVVSTTTSAADGSFRFTLAPGDYAVAGPGNPHLVHVDPGQQLEVNLHLPNP